MAQTEHLPICKAVYDPCGHFEQLVRNFSRLPQVPHRAGLARRGTHILRLIVRATLRPEKDSVRRAALASQAHLASR
jgi:hypothetical protein